MYRNAVRKNRKPTRYRPAPEKDESIQSLQRPKKSQELTRTACTQHQTLCSTSAKSVTARKKGVVYFNNNRLLLIITGNIVNNNR